METTKNDFKNTRKSILDWTELKDKKLVLKKSIQDSVDEETFAYLQSVIKTIPMFDNPSKISDFNYEYVNDKLVNIDTGKPFHWVNQSHYDALGDTIFRHIQELMIQGGLEEILLPLDHHDVGPFNNIFVSKNWQTAKKLMLIIQGSGAVRAGQWARAVCINDRLSIGSILPYLDRCLKEDMAVIVFNPNLNTGPRDKKQIDCKSFLETGKTTSKKYEEKRIPGSNSPREHCLYVWDKFVGKSNAEFVVAVAHSAGGDAIQNVVDTRGEETLKRLCGIAFTDSVHSVSSKDSKHVKHFMQKRCRNWVTSKTSLDTPVRKRDHDCLCVSAGHDTHEYTSGTAIESVFKFLMHKIDIFLTEDPTSCNYETKDNFFV
jgi:hypothetical protein